LFSVVHTKLVNKTNLSKKKRILQFHHEKKTY
jgi:hypothetical protein